MSVFGLLSPRLTEEWGTEPVNFRRHKDAYGMWYGTPLSFTPKLSGVKQKHLCLLEILRVRDSDTA